MIATELGLTFVREDKHWRCREHPELLMYPDGQFGIAGQPERYKNAASALVARPGPDPTAQNSDWPPQAGGTIALPFPMRIAWGNPAPLATKIRCYKVVAPTMVQVFQAVDKAGLRGSVRTFGGCYNYRPKRMGSRPSTHSWGIALDLNPGTNAMGTAGDMDPRLVTIFREHGFKWGGDRTGPNKDPMHFQFCTGY